MKPLAAGPEPASAPRSALLAHYDRFARDLPWRRDRDPYRVLVSEIMLQQTRVETVLKYYDRWLDRFPTLEALATSDEADVLKAWEGLGYYRRARNLHAAARALTDRAFPTTVEGLRALPGVGEYTAGAMASIAFGIRTPAVDGNVRRVFARLYDVPDPKAAWLRRAAAAWVDPERPGDWNQALMELGATVCSAGRPDCGRCPLAAWCAARAAGTQEARPAPKAKRPVPRALFALAVLEHEGRVLVERRPTDGLLGGLWAFPEARLDADPQGGGAAESERESAADAEADAVSEAARRLAHERGLGIADDARRLDPVRHRFSHLDATYEPVVLRVIDEAHGPGALTPRERRWIDPGGAYETALPVAQQKVLASWRGA